MPRFAMFKVRASWREGLPVHPHEGRMVATAVRGASLFGELQVRDRCRIYMPRAVGCGLRMAIFRRACLPARDAVLHVSP